MKNEKVIVRILTCLTWINVNGRYIIGQKDFLTKVAGVEETFVL